MPAELATLRRALELVREKQHPLRLLTRSENLRLDLQAWTALEQLVLEAIDGETANVADKSGAPF